MSENNGNGGSDDYEEFRELAKPPGTKEILEAYGDTSGYSRSRTSVWFRDLHSEYLTDSSYKE